MRMLSAGWGVRVRVMCERCGCVRRRQKGHRQRKRRGRYRGAGSAVLLLRVDDVHAVVIICV